MRQRKKIAHKKPCELKGVLLKIWKPENMKLCGKRRDTNR